MNAASIGLLDRKAASLWNGSDKPNRKAIIFNANRRHYGGVIGALIAFLASKNAVISAAYKKRTSRRAWTCSFRRFGR